MVGGERTTRASTASSLKLRRANARRPLTHSLSCRCHLLILCPWKCSYLSLGISCFALILLVSLHAMAGILFPLLSAGGPPCLLKSSQMVRSGSIGWPRFMLVYGHLYKKGDQHACTRTSRNILSRKYLGSGMPTRAQPPCGPA